MSDYLGLSTWYYEPVKPISRIADRLLGRNQKALIKAGFLDTDLDITDECKDEIWDMLFQEYEEVLVKKAKEIIKKKKDE